MKHWVFLPRGNGVFNLLNVLFLELLNHSKMNDNQFYKLHKKIGSAALNERRKFIGMLPEAYERKLHIKKNYESIFVYAAKLCGLSREQVNRVLNLERKFKDTPVLHTLLVEGKVSHYKLDRIASIVTPDNQEELAQQVEVLSRRAVDTMVRDFKIENGLSKPKNICESLSGQTLELNEEVQERLENLKEKGLNVNKILMDLLDKREEEIEREKMEIKVDKTESRYIPVRIRKLVEKEYGTVCSAPNCFRKSEELHHTNRFALSKEHNPHFLAPLCKAHHEIAHAVDRKVQENKIMVW